MADVFVSYSHADRGRAERLAGAVEESGYSLWWDERLLPSDDYAQVIEQEIADARAVVVAWSTTARESLWVRAEANQALDGGKLVQLTLDGAKLPLPFTALHFLDFRRWGGERAGSPWSELDMRVGGLLRGERVADDPGVREPVLNGLALPVALGWTAIALAALMALAVVAAAGGALPAAQFGTVAAAGFAAAAILLALAAFLTLRIFRASRR
ncbi:MAG TPA: toll/interleukin-1 receptor domain-containing protein [Allosphingosinicella sp.]|jgi:hypothetical protein